MAVVVGHGDADDGAGKRQLMTEAERLEMAHCNKLLQEAAEMMRRVGKSGRQLWWGCCGDVREGCCWGGWGCWKMQNRIHL